MTQKVGSIKEGMAAARKPNPGNNIASHSTVKSRMSSARWFCADAMGGWKSVIATKSSVTSDRLPERCVSIDQKVWNRKVDGTTRAMETAAAS